jgi:allophanate hydrolase subunit 2
VIEHREGFNIVSDGVGIGAIQVPGNGQPIVLLADRQSTGGYPKIAAVISVDLAFLAQRRPGETVKFERIDMSAAQALARERARFLQSLPLLVKPAVILRPSAEELLSQNLIGGVVAG